MFVFLTLLSSKSESLSAKTRDKTVVVVCIHTSAARRSRHDFRECNFAAGEQDQDEDDATATRTAHRYVTAALGSGHGRDPLAVDGVGAASSSWSSAKRRW